MSKINIVEIQSIGIVRHLEGRRRYNEWKNIISEIIIDPQYSDALCGLDEFSHIYVIFHLHEMNKSFKTMIHPTGNLELPLVGAFATRTPNRPSRLGMTICRLLSIRENVIKVKGLDAFDASPVLDIKPYTSFPSEAEVKKPEWLEKV